VEIPAMLKKRSFSLSGHRTSVALEPEFWAVLETEAQVTQRSLASLVIEIDGARGTAPLASALRLHALAAAQGHR
jgi:predicted DNA-binding ribbon-helix-helix protein